MSEIDRSRYLTVTGESVKAAEEAAKRYMGGPFRMEKGNRYYLRFMPAFKVNDQGIPQWWSFGMRHYGVPVIGKEDGKKHTMDCPQTIGARCLVCENKKLFQQMGVWDDFKGCSPRKRVYFNIIDIQKLDAGVQVLEDGPKLWGLLREEFEEENDEIFDPFTGSVLIVTTKDADPWRKLKYPKHAQCSLDEIHEDGLSWALPENLPDLDEQWDFPSLESQVAIFGHMFGEVSQQPQIVAPAPQPQVVAPVAPAPDRCASRLAQVSPGVAAILEAEVIEAEVVEDIVVVAAMAPDAPAPAPAAAPAPAPAPVVAPAPAPAPAVAPAAVLEEAQAAAAAPAPTGTAAVLAEAQAAANPVPSDEAPAPTPTAAPAAGGGSEVLAQFQARMAEDGDSG